MRSTPSKWLLALCAATVLTACDAKQAMPTVPLSAAAQTSPASTEHALAGWYIQHGSQGSFQPCGQSEQWRIGAAADLADRAKAFGLDDDNPIYVRVLATTRASDKSIDISRVEQFGSPTPVRNCAMNGVVIPSAPAPN